MLLLTQEIIKSLPPIYATENVPLEEKIVICKFFTPWARWTWFVFEGEPDEESYAGDYRFFGVVHGFEKEMEYFQLSQLQEVKGPFGLKIERDRSIFKIPYQDRRCQV